MRRVASRAAVLYLSGEVGSRLLTFGVLVLLAHHISPSEFGLVSLYFSLANIASILLALGLPNAVVRYYFDPLPFQEVLGSIATCLTIMGPVATIAVILFAQPLASFLAVPPGLLIPCVIGGIGIAFRMTWTASLRARGRSSAYAATLIAEPVLGMIAVSAWWLAAGHLGYLQIAWCFALATLVIGAIALASWSQNPGMRWSRTVARELIVFSLPLIIHALSMTAISTYDQIVINQTLGPADTGSYAYAYRWGMAMLAMTAAFAALWNPRFHELVRSDAGRARLNEVAARGFGSLTLAGVVLMIALPLIARPLTPVDLRSSLRLVPIVTYAYIWYALYSLVIGYGTYGKRTKRIASGSLAVVAPVTILNYALIPELGIDFAAWSSVGAYVGLFAVQWWLVRDIAHDIRYRRLLFLASAPLPIALCMWLLL